MKGILFFAKALLASLIVLTSLINITYAKELSVQKFELPSGMPVVFYKTEEGYKGVAVRLVVHVGQLDFINGKRALPHLLEHLLFRDNKKKTAVEINTRLDAFAPSNNAEGRHNITVYELNSKYAAIRAVRTLFEMFSNPLFHQKDIDIEKQAILREEGLPGGYLGRLANIIRLPENAKDHAYRLIDPVGDNVASVLSLDDISRDNLVDAHKKYYSPANMTLIVVGDYELDLLQEVLNKFSDDNFGKNSQHGVRHEISNGLKSSFKGPKEVDAAFSPLVGAESTVMVGYVVPGYRDNKEKWAVHWTLKHLLGQLAYEELRLATGLVYTPRVGASYFNHYGFMEINADVEIGNEEKSVEKINKVFSRIASGDFTKWDFFAAKSRAQVIEKRSINDAGKLADYMVNHYQEYIATGKFEEPDWSFDGVDKAQVIEAAKALFVPEKKMTAVVSPALSYGWLLLPMGLVILILLIVMFRYVYLRFLVSKRINPCDVD